MGRHERGEEPGAHETDDASGQDLGQEEGHGLQGLSRVAGGGPRFIEEKTADLGCVVEVCQGADAEELGHHEPDEKADGRPLVQPAYHGHAFGGAGAHDRGLPHGAGDEAGREDHPHDVRGTEPAAFQQGIEAGLAVDRRHRIDNGRPAEGEDGHAAGEDHAEGEDDELDVVGDHHRNHPAHDRVGDHQGEHDGHDDGDGIGIGQARQARYEQGARLQEQAHVQDAGQGEQQAAEDAHAAAEPLFIELGDRHHAQPAQGDDDEARHADDEGDHPGDDRDVEGGESSRESFLSRIHDRHQPQLAPDHGGHGQAGLERPARQDVVPHVPDVPVHVQAYAHGGRHVYRDDQPVQGSEIRRKKRHGSVGEWLIYSRGLLSNGYCV